MKQSNCRILLLIVIGLVVGIVRSSTAQSQSPDQLIFALHVTIPPSWFDPAEAPAQITPFGILYALHDALVRPLPGQRLAPALATSWTESPDGRTYEFKLRQGLRFHNGDAFSAEDVQYSFTRYKGAGAKELQAKVQQVEVVDPLTIRFHLREPWPDFLTFYGTTATAAGLVVPKKYLEKVGEDGFKKFPVGLGPYKFVSYAPGGDLVLEAYQSYWRKVPNIKRLIIKGIPEDTTRLAMLQTGEADISFALEGPTAEQVQRDPRLTLVYTLHASNFWLEFPQQWDPKSVWADKRVRLAVNYALDRQAINEAACLGFCPPAGVIVPRVMEYALPAEPISYDPQKAKQLLAEAGYPNGFDAGELFPIPPFFTVGEAVLNSLQAIGIRVRMRTMERAAFLSLWREKKLQGLVVTAVGASGNAATRAEVFICSQGAYAHGGYPDIDALCQQQAVERNRTRREALLHRIQQLSIERVMFAPIMDFRALVGLGPRIAEHALDRIPLHAFPAWEDVQLKGKTVRVASQPSAPAGPEQSTAAGKAAKVTSQPPAPAGPERVASQPPAPAGPEQSTAAGKAAEKVASAVTPASDQDAFVVLDGIVTPQRLQRKISGYRNVPNIAGFSVQSAPQKTIKELAAAGSYSTNLLSVTTVAALKEAGQSVGVPVEVISAPGRTFHSIVVAPRRLPDYAAEALSQAFRQMPNPLPRPQQQQ
jgi:peptide/nickel transport system substrate-binding protein